MREFLGKRALVSPAVHDAGAREVRERRCGFFKRKRVVDAYSVDSRLGNGGWGTVYSATDGHQRPVALKLAGKVRRAPNFDREVSLQRRCHHHPNIATVHDYVKFNNNHAIVLELSPGGDLFDATYEFGPLTTEAEVVPLVAQLVRAVAHMHSLNVAHRDIKPENVLLKRAYVSGGLMVSDFGHAVEWRDGDPLLSDKTGTVRCLPPEALVPSEAEGLPRAYNPQALDVWGIGVVVFFMLTKALPFADATEKRTVANILQGRFTSALPSFVSQSLRSFVGLALHPDPVRRPSAAQLLHHPLLRSFLDLDDQWEA